jgi:D-aminoacyl-tRNA deacylase
MFALYKPVIIASTEDQASISMTNYLLENELFVLRYFSLTETINNNDLHTQHLLESKLLPEAKIYQSVKNDNVRLFVFKHKLVNLTHLDLIIPEKSILIFLSKHSSMKEVPALTSHFTGNFDNNVLYGGSQNEIGIAYPTFQKYYMKQLHQNMQELQGYEITIEASHHGPTTSQNPIIFIEIGSTEVEWNNQFLASTVCQSLLSTIAEFDNDKSLSDSRIAIGLGGNHYPQKFNDMILRDNIAFASIASKYNLENIDVNMLRMMKSRSVDPVTEVFIEKKTKGPERQRLSKIAESLDLQINFV